MSLERSRTMSTGDRVRNVAEVMLIACVVLSALLVWVPVVNGDLLMDWRISRVGRITSRAIFGAGLIGVIYFAVDAARRQSERFDWMRFILLAVLGFFTFGAVTVGYFTVRVIRPGERSQNWLPYKPTRQSKPGKGVWWSFSPTRWSPRVLDALEHSESNSARMAFDGQIVWEADVSPDLHHAAYWIAEQTLEREKIARPTPGYFSQALDVKRRWFNSEIDDHQLLDDCRTLLNQSEGLWPSNWCTGVNARFAIHNCFLRCLDPDAVHHMVFQAAQLQAMHAAALARCEVLNCDLSELTLTEEEDHEGIRIRGVECPGVDEPNAGEDHSSEDAVTEVVEKQERYLTAALLLRISGRPARMGEDPLSVDHEEWQRIAEDVAAENRLVARAINHACRPQ